METFDKICEVIKLRSILTALKDKIHSKQLGSQIAAVLSVVLLYGIMQLFGITCPIKFLTGISCAGCGMTRACLAFLRLDIQQAFYYHPLFWLPPIVLAALLCRNHLNRKLYRGIMAVSAALFLVVYFYRLLFGNDAIVAVKPENGIIFRKIVYILDSFDVF